MTTHPALLVEYANSTMHVTLNRPESLNALTTDMLVDAAEAVEASADDPTVRAIVLTGSGRAFSSGADLSVNDEQGDGPSIETVDAASRVTRTLRTVPKPVLAAVNGPAIGVGCSFSLAADLTIARESAYFMLTFAAVGLMPDGGATALIPASVGRVRATRMAMLAERIPAPLAVDWGMIAQAVPHESFDTEVERLTMQLANGPTSAFAQTKHAFNATTLGQLEQALSLERRSQSELVHTSDFAEGIAAFRDKRTPNFSGR